MKTTLTLFSFILITHTTFVRAEIVEDSETILHDPFQVPTFMQPLVESKTIDEKPNQSPWKPSLLMTLRAGKNSMANIAGKLVRIGEKVNGYKLIEVYERVVVLENQGKTTRLTLDEDNVTDKDEDNAADESL